MKQLERAADAVELAVRDLGVIGELTLVLQPGMTAVTGETGAGKTLVVEAIELLMGGRADPGMVRHGADRGRGRGAVRARRRRGRAPPGRAERRDGRGPTSTGTWPRPASLSTRGTDLVDLYGQHDHQSLLAAGGAARGARPLRRHRPRPARGGPAGRAADRRAPGRARRRRTGPGPGDRPAPVPGRRAGRRRPRRPRRGPGARGRGGRAGRRPGPPGRGGPRLPGARRRRRRDRRRWPRPSPRSTGDGRSRSWCRACAAAAAELADVAAEVRSAGEAIVQDPERQATIRERRRLLHDLQRKYGESLVEVMEFRDEAARRLLELEDHDRLAAELDVERAERGAGGRSRAKRGWARPVGPRRPRWPTATEAHLRELAMAKARIEISVGDDPGDDVRFLLAANPGTPPAPLDEGRVGRRAGPIDAGAAAGAHRARRPPWCSTRSMPASAAPRPARSVGRWPASARTTRCWS